MMSRGWLLVGAWVLGTGGVAAGLGYNLLAEEKTFFLPDDTTSGHHQIENDCEACHTPLGGVKQDACLSCHAEELKAAKDSHPPRKFDDPRNADRLAELDAAHCVTCHREHVPRATRPMAVTMPDDYCVRCHAEIADERPTHEGLTFDTCASAGCHNFHDNQALYQEFLLRHADQPAHAVIARVPRRSVVPAALEVLQPDAPAEHMDAEALAGWRASGHSRAGVNCSSCHATNESGEVRAWTDAVPQAMCASCHEGPSKGFDSGKHGMRLAAGLGPMKPADARIPMHAEAAEKELSCTSCHGAHAFDTKTAAVQACQGCHADAHTMAYGQGPHARLWWEEVAGVRLPGEGVSCATCHMPRKQKGRSLWVEHNQNDNLRPNEKMVRPVCQQCHGLRFSLDALADAELIRSNFDRPPQVEIASIDMAIEQRELKARSRAQKDKAQRAKQP